MSIEISEKAVLDLLHKKKAEYEAPEPTDKALYNRVKNEAKEKFEVWPSAYASGWLTKEYKRRFKENPKNKGKSPYKGRKKSSLVEAGGLTKWFDEKWVDISRENEDGSHPSCGRPGGDLNKENFKKKYPKCVPESKADDMTEKEKESAVRRKREKVNDDDYKGGEPTYVKTDTKKKSSDMDKKETLLLFDEIDNILLDDMIKANLKVKAEDEAMADAPMAEGSPAMEEAPSEDVQDSEVDDMLDEVKDMVEDAKEEIEDESSEEENEEELSEESEEDSEEDSEAGEEEESSEDDDDSDEAGDDEEEDDSQVEYLGYRTRAFDICPLAVKAFNRIKEMESDADDTEVVSDLLKKVDEFLQMEKDLKDREKMSESELDEFLELKHEIAVYVGMLSEDLGEDLTDDFSFLNLHLKEVLPLLEA